MQDSEQIINRFSRRTYLKDKVGSAYIAPVREPNQILKSIMEYLIETDPDASVEEWARYFLKSLQGANKIYRCFSTLNLDNRSRGIYLIFLKLCQELFFNYLQPIGWQAALKINQMFKSSANIDLHYPVEECFAIACLSIYQPTKLFKGFDFQPYSSVEAYALNTLKRIIKNQIAKELKSKSLKLSDNGLLRRLEKRELERVLNDNYFSQQEINLYCLALQSFKEFFEEFYPASNSDGIRSKKSPTTPLDDHQLSQIAKRYNQQVKRLEIPGKLANAQDIKQMLTGCVQAVRNKSNISLVSIEEQGTGEIVDFSSNPFDTLLKEENQTELMEIRRVILQELEALDDNVRKSLILWLGLGINQEDFLTVLSLQKQYQVARKFQGYQKNILRTLSQLVIHKYQQKNLSEKEINYTIENASSYLKEFLKTYSRNLFGEILLEILEREMQTQEKEILKFRLERLKNTFKEQREVLDYNTSDREIKQKLAAAFTNRIEQKLKVSLLDFKSARESVERFIEIYLQENTAILY